MVLSNRTTNVIKIQYSIVPILQYLNISIKKNIYLFFTFLISTSSIQAQQYSDFLIIEKPEAFTIFNQYAQPITNMEKKLFITFSPFQIVNEDEILGDQITTATRFSFHQKTYFLLKDDNGNYIGDNSNIYRKIFKNCKITGDTIQILKDKSVLFSEKYVSKRGSIYLESGDILIRLFKYRDSYYLIRTGKKSQYGWSTLSHTNSWKHVKESVKRDLFILSDSLRNRIISRLQSANEIYIKYFDYFNNMTGQNKTIPRWNWKIEGNTVSCYLKGAYNCAKQLSESTEYLIQDLENILLGKPFDIFYQKGQINIKPKN